MFEPKVYSHLFLASPRPRPKFMFGPHLFKPLPDKYSLYCPLTRKLCVEKYEPPQCMIVLNSQSAQEHCTWWYQDIKIHVNIMVSRYQYFLSRSFDLAHTCYLMWLFMRLNCPLKRLRLTGLSKCGWDRRDTLHSNEQFWPGTPVFCLAVYSDGL